MRFSARLPLFFVLLLVLFGGPEALASVPPPEELTLDASSRQATWSAGALMLLLLFAAFYAMTRYDVPLPLAMSLVSLSFLVIQWDSAEPILRAGFRIIGAGHPVG